GEVRVAGHPRRPRTVDIETIGAGGGSIAGVPLGHILKVGPQSAGADPGPACYGRGGREPTLTDALVLLGSIPRRCSTAPCRSSARKPMRRSQSASPRRWE